MATILVTDREAAELLTVSRQTLAHWRVQGKGPRFIRIGDRAIRYDRQALQDFITAGTVEADPARAAG